jgi:hypothetical protein
MIGVITSEKSGSFERMGMKLYANAIHENIHCCACSRPGYVLLCLSQARVCIGTGTKIHTLTWDRHKNTYRGLGQAHKYIPLPGTGTTIHTLAWDRHNNTCPGLGQAQKYIPWSGTDTKIHTLAWDKHKNAYPGLGHLKSEKI